MLRLNNITPFVTKQQLNKRNQKATTTTTTTETNKTKQLKTSKVKVNVRESYLKILSPFAVSFVFV